jgi:hypothetical protein
MKIVSTLQDERIRATSILLEMKISEYLRLVSGAERNLEIQRAIVKGFKPYERLRADLMRGCLIPAPVLAAKSETLPNPLNTPPEQLAESIASISPDNVYIVDGLQRTNAIQQVFRSISDEVERKKFSERQLRVEFWPDITVSALTYRMILLNAGQKPMSLRHQIEVVSNALCDSLIKRYTPRLTIYREKDSSRRSGPGQYQFSLLATAFQAFIQKSPHVELRNEVIEELNRIDALETYGQTVGAEDSGDGKDPTKAFGDYIEFLLNFDARLWKIYPESRKDLNDDEIPSARNLLTRDTFHLGLAAAYAWCLGYKPELLESAAKRLYSTLDDEVASDEVGDPLALARLERIQSGFKRKDNVGEQTRNLIFRGFQEFFRSEGLTPFDRCWVQAL